MGVLFEDYLNTIENENTKKTIRSSYSMIGQYEESNKTIDDVKRIFYAAKVKTPQLARNFCTQFRNFARYIQDNNLLQILDSFDTNEFLAISLKVMELGEAKYFSKEKFDSVYCSINNSYVLNPFYTQTLFLCIYEGVYSRDFSVLINLRAADIHGNKVTCRHDDGTIREIDVSEKLAQDLFELSTLQSWDSINKHGHCQKGIYGYGGHHDSCFKIEKREKQNRRNPPKDSYRTAYRNRLREIVSTEIGYSVFAFDIYVSGIMNRISNTLHSKGLSVYDAFSKNNRDIIVKQIIHEELQRSGYHGSISQFKLLVEGHLELFESSSEINRSAVCKMLLPERKRILDEAIQDYLEYIAIESDDPEDASFVTSGVVVPKKDLISHSDRFVYPRNRAVARTALAIANYKCEIDNEHHTFISRRYEVPYTEPHHLVPIAFADNFNVSLDVPENVIFLCSHCHNEIHYGRDVVNILRWLYEIRKDKLELVGIKITFEELLLMYNLSYSDPL